MNDDVKADDVLADAHVTEIDPPGDVLGGGLGNDDGGEGASAG